MPRSVQVAVGASCALGLIGLLSSALLIADMAAAGTGTRWLSAALPFRADGVLRAASPLYLAALVVLPIVLRRDGRKARIAFQLALLATITLGVMTLGLTGTGIALGDLGAQSAPMFAVLALLALLAGSLSRPSAREWFGSGGGAR
jgi:hypothetical protein